MAARCDAADLRQTRELFTTIDQAFGRLDGVIHAAGVFETQRAFRGLEDTGPADCSRRLLPKVDGTIVLADCLRGRKLDFLLMQSSLSSHLGGLGFYAYTAGNAYMDAFAERHRTDDLPWMSVNWDGWIFTERDQDATKSVVSPSFASPDFGVVAEIAIRPSEGAEIYARLMNLASPRLVLVSTADFAARVDSWVNMGSIRRNGAAHVPRAVRASEDRPAMTTMEQQVADAWTEILGNADLTPESNFFAMGGDSLLGVALAYTLSTKFDVVLSVITMFDSPTVSAMAVQIERALRAAQLEVPA
jgi:NAD(P)-dependent dehydrogenase (short-subunit alcohol dehydrogenase family)